MTAKASGRGAPKKAVVALALAALALVLFMIMSVIVATNYRKRHQRQKAIQALVQGKRDGASLDQRTACALAEEALLDGLYEGRENVGAVSCQGDYSTFETHAILKNVRVDFAGKPTSLTACLSRGRRWFVIKIAADDDCPRGPWTASDAKSEAELAIEERQLRKAEAERSDRETVNRYAAALIKARDAISKSKRQEKECPALDLKSFLAGESNPRLKLPTVDADFLGSGVEDARREPNAEWSFLTSDGVRTALDEKAELKSRAAAIRKMSQEGGPFILVHKESLRTWPKVQQEKDVVVGFVSGVYVGSMIIVDTRSAQPLCETAFVFNSSDTVRYRRRGAASKEKRLELAIADDFKEQYETSATNEIKKLGGGQFRLGLKLLE